MGPEDDTQDLEDDFDSDDDSASGEYVLDRPPSADEYLPGDEGYTGP